INDLSDTSPENIFVKDNTKEIFEHHFARETFDISYERDRVVYHSFVRNYLHNNLASISITKHYVDAQKFSMNFPEILKGPFILSCDKDYVNIDKMFQDRHQDNALFQNRIIDFEQFSFYGLNSPEVDNYAFLENQKSVQEEDLFNNVGDEHVYTGLENQLLIETANRLKNWAQ
ncbi:MAG: hypothetical protein KAJ40_02690, partial [Alphaproteobacteria bacterium]|nr:hypothetical protein [Alphaproteobacteria bacterium]